MNLGKIIPEGEDAKRDAIHIAVIPMTAKVVLSPGEHVDAYGTLTRPLVGIVDPFLDRIVCPGQRFWLFLYPNTVTSLRHAWTHPAFDDEPVQCVLDEVILPRKVDIPFAEPVVPTVPPMAIVPNAVPDFDAQGAITEARRIDREVREEAAKNQQFNAAKYAADRKIEAENWLREWADYHSLEFNDLIEGLKTHINTGDRYCFYGNNDPTLTQVEINTIWDNFEWYTGLSRPQDTSWTPFTCSC